MKFQISNFELPIVRIGALCAVMALVGCSSLKPGVRAVPSFAGVKTAVARAQDETKAGAAATSRARAGVKQAVAQATTTGQKETLQKVQTELANVAAAFDGASAALQQADLQVVTLQKQVEEQTGDLNATLAANKKLDAQHTTDQTTIKKQARDVWIYKGGFCVFLIACLLLLLWRSGLLTKLVGAVLMLAAPWSWIVLCAGGPALLAGAFYVLFRLLP